MKHVVYIILSLIFFLLVLRPVELGAQAPNTYVYKTQNGISLNLDVYKPLNYSQSGRTHPAIVFFFGGGWVNGSKAHFKPQSEFFARRGLVCITVSYRIQSIHGTSPTVAIQDARDAMRWVRSHAREFRIDPQKIIASGGSAGGHLALATALISHYDDPYQTIDPRPNALILFNPVVNTSSRGYGAQKMGRDSLLASPYHNVTIGLPPMLIFHGTKDRVVPYQNILDFQSRVQSFGNYCYVSSFPGKSHGFFNQNRGGGLDYMKTLVRSDKFIRLLGYL